MSTDQGGSAPAGVVHVDTGSAELTASLSSRILTLTLNRPAVRNAMSLSMLEALGSMLTLAADSAEVRVVVLTGSGGSFCAGGDLGKLARGESIYGEQRDRLGRIARQQAVQRSTVVRLHELTKPTVAMIGGPAVGAGLALALACEVRYASSTAVLMTGFSRIGLAGDFGCSWLLNRIVGPDRAAELLYLSEPVSAHRAKEIGLVADVLADNDLASHVDQISQRLATVPPLTIAAIRDHLTRAAGTSLADSADAEADWHVRLTATDEHRAAARELKERLGRGGTTDPRQTGSNR